MRINLALVIVFGIALMGCGADQSEESSTTENSTSMESTETEATPVAPKANLLDGKWEANYIMNAPKSLDELYPKGKPTVMFNIGQKAVGGNSGCNDFKGTFGVDGKTLIWEGEFVTTRKMCPDMTGETTFLETLQKANAYSVTERGQTLNLIMGDIAVMRLTRVSE